MHASTDTSVEMLRRMLRIRAFDERTAALAAKGVIPGGVHTSIGHEAAVVGACMAVREDDYMTGYHRSHGHPIGKGAPIAPLMAELFGRATGICHGKGGSMHLADFAVGSLGESGIVGAGIPIAAGAALGARMRGTDRVCLCFFGDGAANSGPFHEALNLAATWKVPAIFFCENNEYAVTLSIREAMAIENVADRAPAYGMPGTIVDGQDVLAVRAAVAAAVDRARAGGGPSLIEAKTYRFREHSEMGALRLGYRSDEEIKERLVKDPIELFVRRLIEDGTLTQPAVRTLEAEVAEEVEAAVAAAESAPPPPPSAAFDDVFTSKVSMVERPAPTLADQAATAKKLSYLDATMTAIAAEMHRDPDVFFLGEDVREKVFGSIQVAEFAADRVRNTPISEAGFVGMSVGAALTGMRPVVQMGVATFMYSAMDQIVNQAAKLTYMSGAQARVPLVILSPVHYGGGMAAHHSDRPFSMFANSPGLKIVVPTTPDDMKGLMTTAIRDDDPVIVFADGTLWGSRGPVPEEEYTLPIGVAEVKRVGSDVTVVALGAAVRLALGAAENLEEEGISVEVVDPRSLVPLDRETIAASAAKTGRLVVVDPSPLTAGFAAELIASVVERGALAAPPVRVTGADVPTPFSPALERHTLPDKEGVEAAVRRVLGEAAPATVGAIGGADHEG